VNRILERLRAALNLRFVRRMTPEQLKRRTKPFAVKIVRFAATLPTDIVTTTIVRQLVSSGTAVGANYRSSCRAKSRPDFISKLTTAEEEADETQYWLELLVEASIARPEAVAVLVDEAEQLVRIFVASIKTARGFSR
jgi:four helix bundle protein